MPIPDFIKALVEKKLGEFCERRVPPYVRHQSSLSHDIRSDSVTIIENRAPRRKELREWTHSPVAKIRYDDKKSEWRLYCRDRKQKWWEYEFLPPMRDIDKVLEEIDRDPTRIFWG